MSGRLYSSTEVVRYSGITYRRIDYWTRIGVIAPTQSADGSGSRRGWSERDIRRLLTIDEIECALRDLLPTAYVKAIWDALAEADTASWTVDAGAAGIRVEVTLAEPVDPSSPAFNRAGTRRDEPAPPERHHPAVAAVMAATDEQVA